MPYALRLIAYLKYFFYIAWNWNIIIAFYIIFHEIKGEKKYGINTIGIDNLDELESKHLDNATIYMPAVYSMLEMIFDKIKVGNITHLLDIGCGKGRAICVAAAKGCKKVSGVDFSKELCLDALNNLTVIQEKQPALKAKIINSDAYTYQIPADVDCIFLFNPFDDFLMKGVVKNIEQSLKLNPRLIKIIYANPLCKSHFIDAGFKETFHSKKMRYIEVSILEK
jgi:SAM-dependent methyltransferase